MPQDRPVADQHARVIEYEAPTIKDENLERRLNELARDGFRLVTAFPVQGGKAVRLIVERERHDAAPVPLTRRSEELSGG
jgi:DNA-binding HxlR family transcriptional regulator